MAVQVDVFNGSVTGFNMARVVQVLDYIPKDNNEYSVGIYTDQDGHKHIILEGKYTDKEQLGKVYSTIFLSGSVCLKRSKAHDEAMKRFPEGTDNITIASVFQNLCFGSSDMHLMSLVTAVIDGVY